MAGGSVAHTRWRGMHQQVMGFEKQRLVAGDEFRIARPGQVSRADRLRAEAQVRNGHRPRLLGVVNKIALDEEIGLVADDLDRVFVGRYRAVRTEAVKDGGEGLLRGVGAESRIERQ